MFFAFLILSLPSNVSAPCHEFGTCLPWRAGLPTFHSLTASQPIAQSLGIMGIISTFDAILRRKRLSRSRSRQPSDPGDPEGQHVLDSNCAPFQPLGALKTSYCFMSFQFVSNYNRSVNTVSTTYCYLSAFKVPLLSPSRDALDGNVNL